MSKIQIIEATENDTADILSFIRELAVYEKLEHEMVATPEEIRRTLFGSKPYAEVVFLVEDGVKVGFALFFHNYSTFLAKPGIYLEDLFVKPTARGQGYGQRLLVYLAQLALKRNCGRLEWSVLDWNKPAWDFYVALGSEPLIEWTAHRVTGPALQKLAERG